MLEITERLIERYDVEEVLEILDITTTSELVELLEDRIYERQDDLRAIFADEDLPFSEFPE
jgi:hypothetical protein